MGADALYYCRITLELSRAVGVGLNELLANKETIMGYSIGWDSRWKRDIGYGVPAYCDQPGCDEEIDRGMGWQCEIEECGCRKFYCRNHLYDTDHHTHVAPPARWHPLWRDHVLTDESWKEWRDKHPEEVAALVANAGAMAARSVEP